MLRFERGSKYTRPDIRERIGLSRRAKGGSWDTGIVEHENEFLILAQLGIEGRTGNRWEATCLRWYHMGGSNLAWQSVQRLLEPGRSIHIFWRTSNKARARFEYAGTGTAIEVADTTPVELLWSFDAVPVLSAPPPVQSPEHVARSDYRKGIVHQVFVNAYERDRAARQACISHYGLACAVCDLQFEERYGALGAGFIHVHQVVAVTELGSDYELNPIEDLRPVCPNCHAMLHRQRPPLSIDVLRSIIREATTREAPTVSQRRRKSVGA